MKFSLGTGSVSERMKDKDVMGPEERLHVRDIQMRVLEKSDEEIGTSVYEIRAQEELLGFLYLDKDSYTLAWKGSLDFHKLGKEAFDFLSLQTRPERRFIFRHHKPEAKALVSFILSGESPELVEYNLE